MRRVPTVVAMLTLFAATTAGTAYAAIELLGNVVTLESPSPPAPEAPADDPAVDPVDEPTAPPVEPTPDPSPTDIPSTDTPSTDVPRDPADDPDVDPVEWAQQRLSELGYYVDHIDGLFGPATASATMAFQKVQGLPRTSVLDESTLAALRDPVERTLRGGAPDRIEVDLTRQVLYVVEDGELVRILPVSSGNGDVYRTPSGGTAEAVTPVGSFRIERRIDGVRRAPLGNLYHPLYFHRGWAIHGSTSVPAHEASHGCVRVTRADAIWLFDRVEVGTPVLVYGGTHVFSPDGQTVQ